jgi:hypothetical protein
MGKKFACVIVIIIFVAISLPLLQTTFAEIPSNSANLSVKGTVMDGKFFQGAILWTILHEKNGTMIIQSASGYGVIHFSISPSVECAETMAICFFSSIADTTNNNVFKVGDTFVFSIDVKSRQEIISLITGSLAGNDVKVSINKTWGNFTMPSLIITNPVKSPVVNGTTTSTTNTGVQNFGSSFNDVHTEYKKLETSITDLQTKNQNLQTTLDALRVDNQRLETSIDDMHTELKKSDSTVQNYGITALVNAIGIIVAIAIIQFMQSNKIEKMANQIRKMAERQDKIIDNVKRIYASAYVSWVHQITFNYEQVTRILYNDGYLNKPVSENREKIRRELMDHYDHDLFITCPKIEMIELVKVFDEEIANKILSSTTHLRAGDWQPYEDNGMALMIENYTIYVKKAIELKDALLQFCDKNIVSEDLKHRETYQYINATG